MKAICRWRPTVHITIAVTATLLIFACGGSSTEPPSPPAGFRDVIGPYSPEVKIDPFSADPAVFLGPAGLSLDQVNPISTKTTVDAGQEGDFTINFSNYSADDNGYIPQAVCNVRSNTAIQTRPTPEDPLVLLNLLVLGSDSGLVCAMTTGGIVIVNRVGFVEVKATTIRIAIGANEEILIAVFDGSLTFTPEDRFEKGPTTIGERTEIKVDVKNQKVFTPTRAVFSDEEEREFQELKKSFDRTVADSVVGTAPTAVPTATAATATATRGPGPTITKAPTPTTAPTPTVSPTRVFGRDTITEAFVLRGSGGPLDNSAVQKAIVIAVPWNDWMGKFFGRNEIPVRVEMTNSIIDDARTSNYDLESAKALLAQSAFPDGFSISWFEDRTLEMAAEDLRGYFEDLGININRIPEASTFSELAESGETVLGLFEIPIAAPTSTPVPAPTPTAIPTPTPTATLAPPPVLTLLFPTEGQSANGVEISFFGSNIDGISGVFQVNYYVSEKLRSVGIVGPNFKADFTSTSAANGPNTVHAEAIGSENNVLAKSDTVIIIVEN